MAGIVIFRVNLSRAVDARGRNHFSFSFTTRFAFDAETTPCVLYDYYNPDARAAVMPAHFVVR
jgi:hypothetical protein